MKDNIRINNHCGTWYVVEEAVFHRPTKTGVEDIPVYLLESEMYGDEAAWLCVDHDLNIILEEVWNGVDDLREYEELLKWQLDYDMEDK